MRLLLVEDDADIRTTLKHSLEAECFVVDAAPDGTRGSELVRTNDYDIAIFDNVLPGKNGEQLCKEARLLQKSFPIIILSVMGGTQDKVGHLDAGADDYLTKPFSFEELLARIRALLRRPKALEEEILVVGDLILDAKKQRATIGTKDISLTRKEFILLEYLMKNRHQVVSRGMLLEHVWDNDADPFSNTIEAHVFNLRKKLARGRKKHYIVTVPGRGYLIEA